MNDVSPFRETRYRSSRNQSRQRQNGDSERGRTATPTSLSREYAPGIYNAASLLAPLNIKTLVPYKFLPAAGTTILLDTLNFSALSSPDLTKPKLQYTSQQRQLYIRDSLIREYTFQKTGSWPEIKSSTPEILAISVLFPKTLSWVKLRSSSRQKTHTRKNTCGRDFQKR